ncbi:pseudouridine synthase [Rapidithrix thailandica]|uniref:Pseudouridine synthase n=1 Tax=Rapidithrix thailandica TaxID=413964 RepID=A0AAW9SE49_9BACT
MKKRIYINGKAVSPESSFEDITIFLLTGTFLGEILVLLLLEECEEMMDNILEILYQDKQLVAINKPHNLLVHRTNWDKAATEFALQKLRDQLGRHVYPSHRLDRKTSGVLLFALDKGTDKLMKAQFEEKRLHKKYLTIVRGHTPLSGSITKPLSKEDSGVMQEALTHYKRLKTITLPLPIGNYPLSKYSLVEVQPETGRTHQIRRHFAHLRHYIVGDKKHGDHRHNKLFERVFHLDTMLLHAFQLHFTHPVTQQVIQLTAPFQPMFQEVLEKLWPAFSYYPFEEVCSWENQKTETTILK